MKRNEDFSPQAIAHRADRRATIGFGIGCALLILLGVLLISYSANRKILMCEYDFDYEDKSSDEISVKFVWNYGDITEAKTKIFFKTDEKITEDQIAEFKQNIENSGYYENIEYGDFWSYQVKAEADYKLDKIADIFGGTDYETVKDSLKNKYSMTCNDD